MHDTVFSVSLELYWAASIRREDMTARMTIAKLVAFLFLQDSVPSNTNLHNVQVFLLGTSGKNYMLFGIIFKRDFREHFRPSANVTNRERSDIKIAGSD